jgi:hypothetical protein
MENFNYKGMVRDAFYSARINFDEFQDSRNWVVVNRLFRFGRTQSVKFCESLNIDPESKSLEPVNEIQ